MDQRTKNNRAILLAHMSRAFPGVPAAKIADDIAALGKIGAHAHRHAEKMCSDESYYNRMTGEDGDLWIKTNFAENVRAILARYPGMRAAFHGDPRGYVLYLHHRAIPGNTWGGDEHGYGIN